MFLNINYGISMLMASAKFWRDVSMNKLSKHDMYVKELCELICTYYDSIIPNFKIKGRKRMLGEIDVLAKKGDKLDIYEVKCSHRPIKARKQLVRIRRYIGGQGDSFFYCGSSRQLTAMSI